MDASEPIHPGEHLQEIIEELGISQYRLAKTIGVPPIRINAIIKRRRSITADTALRIGRALAAVRSSSNHGILDAKINLPRRQVLRLDLTSITQAITFSSCPSDIELCDKSVSSCGFSADYHLVALSVVCQPNQKTKQMRYPLVAGSLAIYVIISS